MRIASTVCWPPHQLGSFIAAQALSRKVQGAICPLSSAAVKHHLPACAGTLYDAGLSVVPDLAVHVACSTAGSSPGQPHMVTTCARMPGCLQAHLLAGLHIRTCAKVLTLSPSSCNRMAAANAAIRAHAQPTQPSQTAILYEKASHAEFEVCVLRQPQFHHSWHGKKLDGSLFNFGYLF